MFTAIDPQLVCSGYEPRLSVPESAKILLLVSVSEKDKAVSVNLKAPVIINEESRECAQYISPVESYSLRHPVSRNNGDD